MTPLPDNILRAMSDDDRKALGKAGRTQEPPRPRIPS